VLLLLWAFRCFGFGGTTGLVTGEPEGGVDIGGDPVTEVDGISLGVETIRGDDGDGVTDFLLSESSVSGTFFKVAERGLPVREGEDEDGDIECV